MSGTEEEESLETAVHNVRVAATQVLQAQRRSHREAEELAGRLAADAERLALAAADGLEALDQLTRSVEGELSEQTRAAFRTGLVAAWQRLEHAGLKSDGAVGDPIDLGRHRIVQTKHVAGQSTRTVHDLIHRGLVLSGRRLRPAEVVVAVGENKSASNRD